VRSRSAVLRRSGATLASSAAVAVVLALSAPGAASAAVAETPNSCKYSFDNKYRDLPSTVSGSASIQPDHRRPAPAAADPGMTVTTPAAPFDVVLPDDLARVGFAVALLQSGANTIPVTGWFAVEGTNTAEGVRRYEAFTLQASTTITTDGDEFVSSTPWAYTAPVFPAASWTATGGDVRLRQAGAGAFTSLPVGPGGQARTVAGSLVLRLDPSAIGGANVYLDCQPAETDLDPAELPDRSGPTFRPRDATPFATVPGPRNQICLNELGRRLQGSAAAWPTTPPGLDRELDPTALALEAAGAPATFTTGRPYALTGTRLRGELSAATVTTFGRFEGGGAALIRTGVAYPLRGAVTIEATNTVEGRQTVALPAGGTWTPTGTGSGASSTWQSSPVDVALPDTTWTPTGAGPVRFRAATPGTAPAVALAGQPGTGPEGPPETGTYALLPHGGTVLQLGTDANGIALDCAAAAVTRTATPAWSDLGRLPAAQGGSQGRYAFQQAPGGAPAFATALDSQTPPPVDLPPAPPVDTAPPTLGTDPGFRPPPTGPPSTTPPAPTPPRAIRRTASVRITTATLRRSKGRLSVALRNLLKADVTSGRVSVVTAGRHRIGRAKARTVTIAAPTSFRLARGRSATVRLRPTKDATRLLRAKRSVRVTIVVTPTKTTTQSTVRRTVTLRR